MKTGFKSKCKKLSNLFYLVFIMLSFMSCQERTKVKTGCEKFIDEIYLEEKVDDELEKRVSKSYEEALIKIGESSVAGIDREAYQLIFSSAFGSNRLIKFENIGGRFLLTKKCFEDKDSSPPCKDYQTEIKKEDWEELQRLIYEFDFWTEKKLVVIREVADGGGFLLEGNRPQAKRCDKKTYKLIVRGNSKVDKMEALSFFLNDLEIGIAEDYDMKKHY